MTQIEIINKEIKEWLANSEVLGALMANTFNTLKDKKNVFLALQKGRMLGLEFENFLQGDVYAIGYKNYKTNEETFSLVMSRAYVRKVALRSGVISISDAAFSDDEKGNPIKATVVVKRKILDEIGEFTGTAYFKEYDTGKNLWVTKPHTMIEKVAEMMALRKACPEELDKAYVEEEMTPENGNVIDSIESELQAKINAAETIEQVNEIYKTNKGKGKTFDKAIVDKKKELEAKSKEEINYPKDIASDKQEPPF